MTKAFEILIVEDSEEMLWAMSNVLEKAGFTVEAATNGKDALEMIRCNPHPGLILLNFFLPDQSGLSVMKSIKKQAYHSHFIGISALKAARKDFLDAGAFAFIEKPFDIKELVSMCRKALNGAERRPSAGVSER